MLIQIAVVLVGRRAENVRAHAPRHTAEVVFHVTVGNKVIGAVAVRWERRNIFDGMKM